MLSTARDSKRCRERDFLKKVHDCVERGGKVLIPVFALGRAQELCILLETYWERMNLKVPVFFSTGLTEKANNYYKMFITWTNEKIRKTFVERNMFDFKHIKGNVLLQCKHAVVNKKCRCVTSVIYSHRIREELDQQ